MDLEQQLSAIGETPESPLPAEQQPSEAPEAVTTEQPTTPEEPSEVEVLKRVIATHPELRERYVSEKFGIQYIPPQQQQPQYQQPAQQPQAPQLPFNAEEWDPFNMEQQSALMSHQLSQALAPAMQFIQQQQQENQMYAAQQQQQVISERETETRKLMDEHIPGFSQLASARDEGKASMLERALLDTAYQRFTEEMQKGFAPDHWFNPRVQQEVLRQIAPEMKQLADKLGVSAQTVTATPAPKPPGSYVEPSAPVPQQSGNAFDAAYKKGDLLGMISTLGKVV